MSYYEDGIRGYVADGHWWMDYHTKTGIVNVCVGKKGQIDWDHPINVMPKLGKPLIIAVEDHITGDYNEIMEWAKEQI